MKGMNLKKLVVVLTALFLMSIFSVTAMAATFDSVNAAQAERDHWAAKGEYYGYTAKNGKTIQKGGSAYAVVRLKNSKKIRQDYRNLQEKRQNELQARWQKDEIRQNREISKEKLIQARQV